VASVAATLRGIAEAHRADHEFVGAVLSLRKADGTTATVTSGTQTPGGPAVDPDIPWGIGSVTKTFVAVVVLQLAEEGKIDLDAPVGRYFADAPALAPLTPRQLLQHTTGLNEYLDLPSVIEHAHRKWAPMALVAEAEGRGRLSAADGTFHYSNTNYLVLGELVRRVTGQPWDAVVRHRILDPLHMRNTHRLGVHAAPGYGVSGNGFPVQTDRQDPSVGGAAGAMASTAADLLTYTRALQNGHLLSRSSTAAMRAFIPGEDYSSFGIVHSYGLGLERYASKEVTVYGHMGTGSAHAAFIGFDPKRHNTVVVTMNVENPGPQAIMAVEALEAIAAVR
jgi:D-alanyl-D-alanine carboxypeptidase